MNLWIRVAVGAEVQAGFRVNPLAGKPEIVFNSFKGYGTKGAILTYSSSD